MRNRSRQEGMTLIEILIALVVMVLGVLGILALFPPALQSSTESVEETNAAILASSVAHGLMEAFQTAEEDKASATLKLKCTLSHDLQAGSNVRGRYTFVLPPLPTDPTMNPEWWHYPSATDPPGQGGSGAGDTGSKMVNGSYDPETDDRLFNLGGDQWILDTVKSVHDTNDPTDPLVQFAFSFDIRKVDDMWYQRKNPATIDPYRKVALKLEDYEGMIKLYEVRIHILRTAKQVTSSGGSGQDFRRYITTISKRISVK